MSVEERIDVIVPHALATLRFEGCRVPDTQRLGGIGGGFKLAMATSDVFRTSVAGGAIGYACRALAEAGAHAARHRMFDSTLADMQPIQAALADMAPACAGAAWSSDCIGRSARCGSTRAPPSCKS